MHRQVASLLSTSSPGRLAIFGNALGARGVDMVTAGGAEWMHSGPVTLIVRNDWGTGADELEAFAGVMQSEKFPYLVFRTIEVQLKDVPGALGAAAEAMGRARSLRYQAHFSAGSRRRYMKCIPITT